MTAPLTTPAPRAAHPPVQRVVEVVGRRPVNAYVELTLAAPEIAERAEPGQFVAFADRRRDLRAAAAPVDRDRRQPATASSPSSSPPHGPGSTWLAGLQVGRQRGRRRAARAGPFPLPAPGTPALLVGGGYGAAALVGLARAAACVGVGR